MHGAAAFERAVDRIVGFSIRNLVIDLQDGAIARRQRFRAEKKIRETTIVLGVR